jgi:hypothetical protein
MKGAVGSYIRAASLGSPVAQTHLSEVFGDDFQSPAGWKRMLDQMPGGSVETLMNRKGAWWTRECFQALYVACWIDHPVEKGSYMIQLSAQHYANVRAAYDGLLRTGALQSRISSHLSKQGASAHEGWDFLKGYGELLLQMEGDPAFAPYLFLKCEGHALEKGLSLSTVKHLASWVKKGITGSGQTASQALQEWATFSNVVEGRAAENFGKGYEKLLKQLGLSSRKTTVEEAMEALVRKAGFNNGLPNQFKGDTNKLGQAMLGPQGYIEVFKRQRAVLKKNGVDFDEKAEKELTGLAERMAATATSHAEQHYNEIRVTPADLDLSLANFRSFIP